MDVDPATRPPRPARNVRYFQGQREEVTAVAVLERNAPEVLQRRRPQGRAGQRLVPLAGVTGGRCQGSQLTGGEPAQREPRYFPELLQGTKAHMQTGDAGAESGLIPRRPDRSH
jgi:hypothetical protein